MTVNRGEARLPYFTLQEWLNQPAPEEDIIELALRIHQGHATDFDK
jgi:hypothetical protein